ncbi:hypothetical protein ACTXT7_001441 [Hymenolepis weldensis]
MDTKVMKKKHILLVCPKNLITFLLSRLSFDFPEYLSLPKKGVIKTSLTDLEPHSQSALINEWTYGLTYDNKLLKFQFEMVMSCHQSSYITPLDMHIQLKENIEDTGL